MIRLDPFDGDEDDPGECPLCEAPLEEYRGADICSADCNDQQLEVDLDTEGDQEREIAFEQGLDR